MNLEFRLWDKEENKWLHGSIPDEINDLFDINYFVDKSMPNMMLDLSTDAGRRYEIVLPEVHPETGKLIFLEPYT